MKDVQKLKIWPTLKQEGFTIKEIRSNGIIYGRGAILMPDYKTGFPFISIEPLTNGHWKLTVDYFSHQSSWEGNPMAISKRLLEELWAFKKHLEAKE